MNLEKFKSIELMLEKERNIYIENIKICFDLMEKAYERLFKMQYQVGTFSLVGIFTIMSWGKFQFIEICTIPIGNIHFYFAIFAHVISLVWLTRINSLSSQLQVWKQELHKYDFQYRQETIIKINSSLKDNEIAVLSANDLEEINVKLQPYNEKIAKIAPQIWNALLWGNYIFYISIALTISLVIFNLKIN